MKLFTFLDDASHIRRLLRISFFFFLITLPLGTKKFILSFAPDITEATSFFIYASDIAFFLFLFMYYLWHRSQKIILVWNTEKTILLLFLFCAFFSIVLTYTIGLAFMHISLLTFAIVMAIAVRNIISKKIILFREIVIVIASMSVMQALIGFVQFLYNKSIGLWFLGEPIVKFGTKNMGRVVIEGGRLLRAYGTFPHANIFAGFLVLGLISLYFLFLTSETQRKRIMCACGMLCVALGLMVSFSRSGWIVATFSTFIFSIFLFKTKIISTIRVRFFLMLSVFVMFFLLFFSWAIFPRVHLSREESSVRDRVTYNRIGVDMIRAHPFGVGIGVESQEAAREGRFAAYGLNFPWDEQPTHNIYILIAAEIGILGLIFFLWFVGRSIICLFSEFSLENVTLFTLILSLLLFGLVDHFPWDLHAGRLMLWLLFGMMMGLKPSSFNG